MRAVILSWLCAPVLAQQTWIVDAQNGPGAQFVDLPAAVAAAASGDTIVVRPGSYTPPSISKALKILGTAGVTVQGSFFTPYPDLVRNLSTQAEVFWSQVTFAFSAQSGINTNQGRVVFDHCVIAGTSFSLTDCSVVFLNASVLSRTAMRVERSRLIATDSSISHDVYFPVLVAIDSTIEIANTAVSVTSIISRPAIDATRSSLVVRRGPGAAIIGVGSAVNLVSSSMRIDPAVALTPATGAITGSGAVFTALPSLSATTAPLGGVLDATLRSSPGDVVFSAVSVPAAPLELGAMGTFWLDVPTELVTAIVLQGPSGVLNDPVTVPNTPALAGLRITRQFLAGPNAASFALSNPVQLRIE